MRSARASLSRGLGCQAQGVSQPRGGAESRRGVTLLELIVVLALLGLVLAIAAPAFIVPDARGTGNLESVLATARRAAVLRGEPVTLAIDDAGAWRLDGDATASAQPIATGRLDSPTGALRVRISPLGSCIPEPAPGSRADWSAVGCGPGGAAQVRRQ